MFKFSQRSKDKMAGVHPSLVSVMEEAIKGSPYDFSITEGVRTPERQRELYEAKKSLTLNSKHLVGRAVDIAVFVDGKVTWDYKYYLAVATHIKNVAVKLGVDLIWGGDWRRLVDSPHFELRG